MDLLLISSSSSMSLSKSLPSEKVLTKDHFYIAIDSQSTKELIDDLVELDTFALQLYTVIARLQCQTGENTIGRRPIQVEEIITDFDKLTHLITEQVRQQNFIKHQKHFIMLQRFFPKTSKPLLFCPMIYICLLENEYSRHSSINLSIERCSIDYHLESFLSSEYIL